MTVKYQWEVVLEVLNQHDPEGLEPGSDDGCPKDEYEAEAREIARLLARMGPGELDLQIIEQAVNAVWVKTFTRPCPESKEIAATLLAFFAKHK
jgi:hypothetical protein